LGGTLQECGPHWLGLFAGYGVHSSGACRALCVEAEFRHRAQPGQHARTCLLNRQGTAAAAAAHSHTCFSRGCSSKASCTPLQHTLTRMQTHIHRRACEYTQARTHTHAQTHMHAYTRANTHSHAHMHMHAHVARVMGFANFPASLATHPHLS
jgi:hypothetical protein